MGSEILIPITIRREGFKWPPTETYRSSSEESFVWREIDNPVSIAWMKKLLRQIPVIAGIFCCYSIFSLDDYCSDSVWVAGSVSLFTNYLLASILALWAVGDAARRGRAVPYDFGTFVFFVWFVVLPIYLVKTRGWRAIFPILSFFGIMGAAAFFPYFLLPV